MSRTSKTLDKVRELLAEEEPRPSLAEALTAKLEDGEEPEQQSGDDGNGGEPTGLHSALTDAYRNSGGD